MGTPTAAEWLRDRIAVSPCSNPEMGLTEVLETYGNLGFVHFEAFTSWVRSSLHIESDPENYRSMANSLGMDFTSLHLPPIDGDVEASLARAVSAASFAEALGVETVIYKAATRNLYIEAAHPLLDAIEGLNVVPVLQNHSGTALSPIADYEEVLDGIADDRMRTLLEIGHFHSVGVSWREGLDLLQETVQLVHIKDQIGIQSVLYGTGEIDLKGLFHTTKEREFKGRFVVEMEVADSENTVQYLADALLFLEDLTESMK